MWHVKQSLAVASAVVCVAALSLTACSPPAAPPSSEPAVSVPSQASEGPAAPSPSDTRVTSTPQQWLDDAITATQASGSFVLEQQLYDWASELGGSWCDAWLTDYTSEQFMYIGSGDRGCGLAGGWQEFGAEAARYYPNMHEGDIVVIEATSDLVRQKWDTDLPWQSYRELVAASTKQDLEPDGRTLTVMVPEATASAVMPEYWAESVPPDQWTFQIDDQGRLIWVLARPVESPSSQQLTSAFVGFGAPPQVDLVSRGFDEFTSSPVTVTVSSLAELEDAIANR